LENDAEFDDPAMTKPFLLRCLSGAVGLIDYPLDQIFGMYVREQIVRYDVARVNTDLLGNLMKQREGPGALLFGKHVYLQMQMILPPLYLILMITTDENENRQEEGFGTDNEDQEKEWKGVKVREPRIDDKPRGDKEEVRIQERHAARELGDRHRDPFRIGARALLLSLYPRDTPDIALDRGRISICRGRFQVFGYQILFT
jgi:hypothetical protein